MTRVESARRNVVSLIIITASSEESSERLDDVLLLRARQLRIHRERERGARGALGLGEVALAVSEVGEAGLQVERDGVIDLRADAVSLEVFEQRVAALFGDADDVLVEDVARARQHVRRRDYACEPGFADEARVDFGPLASRVRPTVEVREFDAEHGGLEGVEAAVEADLVVVVLGRAAVDAEAAQPLGRRGAV